MAPAVERSDRGDVDEMHEADDGLVAAFVSHLSLERGLSPHTIDAYQATSRPWGRSCAGARWGSPTPRMRSSAGGWPT